ncbi:MAG TPA: hypothetical protein VM452_15510, partial [Caulifigura sp.]|nr:hypothetical protein [Caulifigura sp.]
VRAVASIALARVEAESQVAAAIVPTFPGEGSIDRARGAAALRSAAAIVRFGRVTIFDRETIFGPAAITGPVAGMS